MSTLEKIEQLFKENSISASSMCLACGLNKSSFSYWKTGKSMPSLDALIKIANYFNVSLDFLTGRDEPKEDIDPQFKKNIVNISTRNGKTIEIEYSDDEIETIIKMIMLTKNNDVSES